MTKPELRKLYKSKRKALSHESIDDLSLQIANKLLELDIWDKSFYHIFLTIDEQKEVNTDFILNVLSGKDKHIVVPKSDFKTGKMTNYLLTDATIIKKNLLNIPEPIDGIIIHNDQIQVVFIPLLSFDKHGHRVGYGKGFYDKFLSECNSETIKIGLSFFEPEDKIKGVFDSDVSMDFCVTPNQVHEF